MLLVQNQYSQNSRKHFDAETKQDTSKQFYTETNQYWDTESCNEEKIVTSGNETETEDILYAEPSDVPEEILETRRQITGPRKKAPKNVRFEGRDFACTLESSETSSLDNEYLDIDYGYSLPQEPEASHKVKEHIRVPHKPKYRTLECSYNKKYGCERRPKSNPEKGSVLLDTSFIEKRPISLGEYNESFDTRHRLRRKEHRCGTHDKKFRSYKFEYGEEPFVYQHHGDCCDHCPVDDGRLRKNSSYATKPVHKHVERKIRVPHCDNSSFAYYATEKYYPDECYKTKKKLLEAVQEQQEQFSDSTYKIPCNKNSSQTMPAELTGFTGKRSLEKLMTNSSQSDWLCCGTKQNETFLGENREAPSRIHKMRSRRTRMNRLKNGWKKAFVQSVRDSARNERVGVLVMGSKGPEFYAKNSKKSTGQASFRKSKTLIDGAPKSFKVMTVDCKNVFLSSSELGPKTNFPVNDLICPEDDLKVEEKMTKFSKNVSEIVKTSEEKFYKALGSDQASLKKPNDGIYKGAGEGGTRQENKEEKVLEEFQKPKYSSIHLPFDSIYPRSTKSVKKSEKKVNEQSKAMAEALNKQAKQYKENYSSREETYLENLKELQKKYPPKELSPKTVEENLSFWGMKLEELSAENKQKEITEIKEETKTEEIELTKKEESQTGSIKSTEQISNKQRKKKYYETNGTRKVQEESCAGDAAVIEENKVELAVPKMSKRGSKVKKWTELPNVSFEPGGLDSNSISNEFRNLVENGCAISAEESKNLQDILNRMSMFDAEVCSNNATSSSSSEIVLREDKTKTSPESAEEGEVEMELTVTQNEDPKKNEVGGKENKSEPNEEEANSRKVLKMKNYFEEKVYDSKQLSKKVGRQSWEAKSRKKIMSEDKIKFFREALPSLAAQNEAAHLKQLKRYIDRFIDRVEASTASEYRRKKEIRLKPKESGSTDSSEVKVDARKILEFVSNPFKKISSDVTINIAKKLTDALVQDKASKAFGKVRKNSENCSTDEDVPCGASSRSGKLASEVQTFLQGFGFFTAFTCGCLFVCSVLYFVKKYK